MIEFQRKGPRRALSAEEIERRMAEGDATGWLYLIEDPVHQAIKVGWAKDPERRLKTLQCGHPGELTLVAVIPGTRITEHRIHRRLSPARRFGEWFNRDAVLELLADPVRDFGLKLTVRAGLSRSIPERRNSGLRPKVEFVVEL